MCQSDTFCNAVDCRFELALEVQRWTRARSECLPGGGKNYSYATDLATLLMCEIGGNVGWNVQLMGIDPPRRVLFSARGLAPG